ncbi:U-box domain-containing protein 33-like [Tasmannia lanceolata]|uniref:U-box domain-containing protein 33-like n=1 Tax=Tasmannia lanceolata TaxID=3420 RepID=UPI0040648AE9
MAVVSSMPVVRQQIEGSRSYLHDSNTARSVIENIGEIEEELPALLEISVPEERIFVAVGKEKKENMMSLIYALKNARGKKIGILHVHQPASTIPMLGGKFPVDKLKPSQVKAHREQEREKMHKILDEYVQTCASVRVQADKFIKEMDDIERGIVELVAENGVSKLVMGAASDKHYSRRMRTPKSKKAITVSREADLSCQIWFVCKGNLVCTREANLDGTGVWVTPPSPVSTPSTQAAPPIQRKSSSLHQRESESPIQDHLWRSKSDNFASRGGGATTSVEVARRIITTPSWEGLSVRSTSEASVASTSSTSDDGVGTSASASLVRDEECEEGILALTPVHEFEEDVQLSSLMNDLEGRRADYQVFDQLDQAMVEADNCKREAFEESNKRRRAEKDAVDAIRKVKETESLYAREMKQRKDIEELLAQEIRELENIKIQQETVIEELGRAREQQKELEIQVADSDRIANELKEKLESAQQLLNTVERESEELQRERDEAVREAERLRKEYEDAASSSHRAQNLSLFSFTELEVATQKFDNSLMIGEGGYGSVYMGDLRHTKVAIKMLNPRSMQGRSEFQREVEVLSRVRHPNLVTLIGTCPETWSLIYEYLPNGSLEDRLICKEGTPPLSWKIRTRIAAEICSALIFLHCNKPHMIIHGDLKPANILIDSNFVSKLGDFGISRLILPENSTTALGWRTDPKGTFVYMDPEFLSSGVLTHKSDVYSFGIIILQLLTGKPGFGIAKEVKEALEKGNLHGILDNSAGDWPFVQAKQLAHMGLRCCDMQRRNRPDLVSEVSRVLDPMRASLGSSSSSSHLMSQDESRMPSYFICPIFQEIMRDPQVAADGFTYEAEAIKGWLDSGHDTSPMTNNKLNHCELIPNHSLRSAIREWLHQP